MKPNLIIFTLIFLLSGIFGCKKEKEIVPVIPVDISIPRSIISNRILVEIVPDENNDAVLRYGKQEWQSVTLSSKAYGKGIYLYMPDPNFPTSYRAWDKICTYRAFEDYCSTEWLNDFGYNIVECPCCKSRFVLDNGLPVTGSAAGYPLKEYRVSVTPSAIRITR